MKRNGGGIKIEEKNAEAKPENSIQEPSVTKPESGGGAGGIIKLLVLVVIVAGITAGIVYQATGVTYQALIKEKDAELEHQESAIKDLEGSVKALQAAASTGGEAPPTGDTAGKLVCSTCHAIDQTKGFHDVGTIKLLSESKGQTPRLCTTCHGSSPHNVHKKKTDSGEMSCEDCHVSPEGDFITPQVPEGKILVCELCHAQSGKPEDVGNYVSIHIVEGNRECDICHMGDPVKIHKRATEKLGVVE